MQVYYGKSQHEIVPGFLFKSVSLAMKRKKNFEVTLEDEESAEPESENVTKSEEKEVAEKKGVSEIEVENSKPNPQPEPEIIKTESSPVEEIVTQPIGPVESRVEPEDEEKKKEEQENQRIALEKAERTKQRELIEAERKQKEAQEIERLKEQKKREDKEKREKQAALLKEKQGRAAKEIEQKREGIKQQKKAGAKIQFNYQEEEEEGINAQLSEAESESEAGSDSKSQLGTKPVGSTVVQKQRKISIKYEEEEEGIREEDSSPEETGEGPLELLNPLDTPLNPSVTRKEVSASSDKRKFRCVGGLFAVTLLGSVALWIFLFRSLAVQNAKLGQAVLGVPTLGEFHGKYSDFFTAYNANVDEMIRARQLVSGIEAPARASLFGLFAQREAVTRSVAKLRDSLTSQSQGRLLAQSSGQKSLVEVAQSLEKQLGDFRSSVARLAEAQRTYVSHFDGVVEALRKMYRDSLEMIDLYGEFFYMTHRIWVATENIFRLFERRAIEVNKEMSTDHYQPYSAFVDQVILSQLSFATFSRVTEIPAITVISERPATLICSTSAEIDNENFSSLERNIELKLLTDSQNPNKYSSFKYHIESQKDRFSFVQAIEVPRGSSTIQFFAKVEKGDIRFENYSCTCIKLTDYAKWPVNVDYRLT